MLGCQPSAGTGALRAYPKICVTEPHTLRLLYIDIGRLRPAETILNHYKYFRSTLEHILSIFNYPFLNFNFSFPISHYPSSIRCCSHIKKAMVVYLKSPLSKWWPESVPPLTSLSPSAGPYLLPS